MKCTSPTPMTKTSDSQYHHGKNHDGTLFYRPCGQCMACRISYAQQWAIRATHESQMHKENCFITLTYEEDTPNMSLIPSDLSNFFRRLRYEKGKNFKYLACGEYGTEGERPHYHALLFGLDFPRLKSQLVSENSSQCPELYDLWKLGHVSIGNLTPETCNYVAQYSVKKINGKNKDWHYKGRIPEFIRVSTGGIGKDYALRYSSEILNRGYVQYLNEPAPLPRYYEKLYEKNNLLTREYYERKEQSLTDRIDFHALYAKQLANYHKNKSRFSETEKFRLQYLQQMCEHTQKD